MYFYSFYNILNTHIGYMHTETHSLYATTNTCSNTTTNAQPVQWFMAVSDCWRGI